jgi:hypothetical protein
MDPEFYMWMIIIIEIPGKIHLNWMMAHSQENMTGLLMNYGNYKFFSCSTSPILFPFPCHLRGMTLKERSTRKL